MLNSITDDRKPQPGEIVNTMRHRRGENAKKRSLSEQFKLCKGTGPVFTKGLSQGLGLKLKLLS